MTAVTQQQLDADIRAFLRDFWLAETAPSRPAVVFHRYVSDGAVLPEDPDPLRNRALQAVFAAQHSVPLGDDRVPVAGCGVGGPNAMIGAFGSGDEVGESHWTKPLLAAIAAVDTLEKPSVEDGLVGESLAIARALAADGDVTIGSLDLQSPLTIATQLVGVAELFMAMYDDPGRVHRLLNMLTDFTIDVVEAQRAIAGERFCPIFWPGLWAPPEVGLELSDDYMLTLSPDLFEEFSLPCLSRLSRHFGGLFLHSCSIYPAHLPSLGKIPGLRGVNCDLSMSAPLRGILDALPGAVVSPHIYMNKEISRPSQAAWLQEILAAWRPGDRLFPAVLGVIYNDETQTDLETDWPAIESAWRTPGYPLRV